ncbi:cytochrome c oxidase subunit 3 [Acidisphaera rubrifaciens]|uniref:Cytochrome bo(3) ubiquinol oxidase subunit 3 n=1 Tax=Acidisphaera rubrifaciens HS-AP3 TaxID=1231350 RepID=A0A0D6P521_9PROT|nr:cytochrome c oxidase subunit 3 [Acidisphaera rubrifaciens]GAN75989.1 cytochrome o ubiquinol oxidase subunit III [Acidisphaera rubrifaciens HS-AP3]
MDRVAPPLRHPGLNLADDPRDTRRRFESDVFGFWIFLMSDAVLFALLFAIYGTMLRGTAGAPGPADVFKIGPAFIETLLLLTSSTTFGMASIALKRDAGAGALVGWLIVTLGLGLAFLGMEAHDFVTMAAAGATPERSGFLSAFFVLVGMHGLHVTIGSIWLCVMLLQLATIGRDRGVKLNLLRLGLFWHFLDVIWIAIFSVVYLQGLIR